MKRSLVLLVLALGCVGCQSTSSTEVGVRTCLLGILEKRGEQQVYPPGGTYLVMPFVNNWDTLPVQQQNLLMNANTEEGDRPVPDDLTFKTKDGNNVHIDVNIMWRINPANAADVVNRVGRSVDEIKERVVRPVSRATIRDVFNKITSEEYYHVDTKNRVAAEAREQLEKELQRFGILVDSMQVQQHRFDPEYQAAIDAQKQAEADVQTLLEQQKNIVVQKESELQAKRAEWNQKLEDAKGQAGRIRNESDAYASKRSNAAKALLAQAKAEADATRKQAEALNKLGGDSYVKMQLAKQFSGKHFVLVPQANVSTMNVNQILGMVLGDKSEEPPAQSKP
jgi:regulator of protease activity HflC (stomatin/prohibitin superfamily)